MAPITRAFSQEASLDAQGFGQFIPPRMGNITRSFDYTAIGPWPPIIDGAIANKGWQSWIPNRFRDVQVVKAPANYGGVTSLTNFGFRGTEFEDRPEKDLVGLYPGTVPVDTRPTYNRLYPIVWGLKITNPAQNPGKPGTLAASTQQTTNQYPMQFTPGATASLSVLPAETLR